MSSRYLLDEFLIQCYIAVLRFIDIKVLDDSIFHEILKLPGFVLDFFNVFIFQHRLTLLINNYQWSTYPTKVRIDPDFVVQLIITYRDVLVQ